MEILHSTPLVLQTAVKLKQKTLLHSVAMAKANVFRKNDTTMGIKLVKIQKYLTK